MTANNCDEVAVNACDLLILNVDYAHLKREVERLKSELDGCREELARCHYKVASARLERDAKFKQHNDELITLRASEAKAWGLVEGITVAVCASDAAYPNNALEFLDFAAAVHTATTALAARKAGG